jgi:diamine N-acetyltransferase
MPVSLADIAANPRQFTTTFRLASLEEIVFRPLEPADVEKLAEFLTHLSPETRIFSIFPGYDRSAALELCDAINRYDKLRFVLEAGETIIGLMEFSLDVTENDRERFQTYGVELSAADARFGPTLADAYQDQGIGSRSLPCVLDIARQLGKQRLILWGGVLANNHRAIRYYEKNGFIRLGEFTASDRKLCLDMLLSLPDNS